jgi:predicted esterase
LSACILTACGSSKTSPPVGRPSGAVGAVVAGSGSGSGGSGGSGGAGGAGGSAPAPAPDDLPKVKGKCPMLVSGKNTFTIPGQEARSVELRFSGAADKYDGALVVVWHGETQSAKSVIDELVTTTELNAVLAEGGIVAAPERDAAAGASTWFTSGGLLGIEDDFVVMDQILACVLSQNGVDTRRIHVIGFQQGAIQAIHSAIVRSRYVASAVIHSGGISGMPKEQAAAATYPLMILHGGKNKDITTTDYASLSIELASLAKQGKAPFSAKHFSILCDHGAGPEVAKAAIPSTFDFLQAHRFGVASPYGTKLPSGFPKYCAIQ